MKRIFLPLLVFFQIGVTWANTAPIVNLCNPPSGEPVRLIGFQETGSCVDTTTWRRLKRESKRNKRRLTIVKTLTGESITSNSLAENGEILTYTITVNNLKGKDITTDVTEVVPIGTTYIAGNDFVCVEATEGSTCQAERVTIPRRSSIDLTFEVIVNTSSVDIINTAHIIGLDCALAKHACTVNTVAAPSTGDNINPTLSVLTPIMDASVVDTGFSISGTASDAGGIANISIFDGTGTHLAVYNSGAGTWTADLPAYPGGADVTLTVTATDNSGNQTVSEPVVVHVELSDSIDPALSVLTPVTGANVVDTGFSISGTASDAGGIANISIFDGTGTHLAIYNSGAGTWTADLPAYPGGADVTLTVTATDNSGNQTVSEPVVVHVELSDSIDPALSVLTPVTGANVVDTGFSISGTASDAGGIANISIFDGTGTHLAIYNSGAGTWTADLPAYPGGTDVTLVVTATDNSGNQTVSNPIVVHIQLPIDITQARHLINRISYGITPLQLESLKTGAFDLAAYKTAQLSPVTDSGCLASIAVDQVSSNIISPFLTLPIATPDSLQNYALLMAAYNDCQLREVLTQFWDNHFSTNLYEVNIKSGHIMPQSVAWELAENNAFRANAFGNFRNLVEMSAKSPAMLYYLGGYNSRVGGANENYPRELMELHTVSVNAGYTNLDAIYVARAFTGWTVVDPDSDPLTNNSFFECNPATHDYDTVYLDLGYGRNAISIPTPEPHDASSCEFAAQAVIDILIAHPNTGEFICQKLVELLVSDQKDPAVVNICKTVYVNSLEDSDQIFQMVSAILETPEFSNHNDYLEKVKTPLELEIGLLRNFDIVNSNVTLSGDLGSLNLKLNKMSMPLFSFPTPDGFPEQAVDWISPEIGLQRLVVTSDMAFNANIFQDPIAFFALHTTSSSAVEIVDYLLELVIHNQHTILERNTALGILNNTNGFDGSSLDFDTETDVVIKENRLRTLFAVVFNYPGHQYQ